MLDFFISYKCTDGGEKTKDCAVAGQLAERLRQRGFSVFFSEVFLQEQGEAEYIKAIDQALREAQVLILLCSKWEYILEGWVFQEWTSFLNQKMADKRKQIFTYLIDVPQRELPTLLGTFQSFRDSDGLEAAVAYLSNAVKPGEYQAEEITFPEIVDRELGVFGRLGHVDIQTLRRYEKEEPRMTAYLEAVYYLRQEDYEHATPALDKLMELHSVKGANLLARLYRRGLGRPPSVEKKKEILRQGQQWWLEQCAQPLRDGVGILLLAFDKDDGLLAPTSMMANNIQDLLRIFGLSSDLLRLTYHSLPLEQELLDRYDHIIFLTNQVESFQAQRYAHPELLEQLQRIGEQKLCLGINNLQPADIGRPFRKCRVFEMSRNGGVRYCRHMINKHAQDILAKEEKDFAAV